MSYSRSSLSVLANTKRIPQVLAFGETTQGLALQLRADPAGVLEAPQLPNLLVAIHVGAPAKISCRRGGKSHTGSAVHGDIDIIPAHTSARWEIHDQNDTALILGLPPSLLELVAEEQGFDSRRFEIRNRFQVRDPQLENIAWALKAEMESNYPSGRLYVDSLAVSIASRLVSVHSSIAQLLPQRSIGKALLGPVAAAAKLTKSFRLRSHEGPDSPLDMLLLTRDAVHLMKVAQKSL